MDPDTAQGLVWLIFAMLLGVVTAKIASDRGVPGSPIYWWIAGTFLFIVAIPLGESRGNLGDVVDYIDFLRNGDGT